MKNLSNLKGQLAVITAALLYGFFPVLCQYTFDLGNTPLTLTFFRNFFAMIIIAIIMLIKHHSLIINLAEFKLLVKMALIGVLGTNLLLSTAYLHLGVGTSTTIHFLYPVIVALYYKYRFKTKCSIQEVISLGLSLVGIILFVDSSHGFDIAGLILALGSSFTFAYYLLLMQKREVQHMDSYKLSFYLAAFSSLILALSDVIHPQLQFNLPLIAYGYMLIIAFIASFLAVIILKVGIEIIGAKKASSFLLFEPVSSIFFGYLFLHEVLTGRILVGCGLIIIALCLIIKK